MEELSRGRIILITGAAGYVGAMLVKHFCALPHVEKVIGVDKEPLPEFLAGETKLHYIHANTADGSWQGSAKDRGVDTVINTAWQIREIYGNHPLTWKWNIEGSDAVFDFAISETSVKTLIHFSTVASYGAFKENTIEHRFTEDEQFREVEYLYAEEKRISEVHLEEKVVTLPEDRNLSIIVVRPAAITGPRGRFMRIRFGLQAALAGQLKDSFVYRIVSGLVSFVPVTPKWCRQFIHEDDVVGLIDTLVKKPATSRYQVFNICPPGDVVLGADMAKAVGKKTISVPPWFVRIAFFIFWHLTRGKVPTGKGAWKSYSYPIAVDGSKLTKVYGYEYQHESFDAFYYTNGTYEYSVPEEFRRNPR